MEWQQFFRKHILDRGYDYFCDSAVSDLKKVSDVLTATVEGTSDYSVEISFNGELIADMSCSCPYAEDGNNCKHMAAVLFEYEKFADSPKSNEGDKVSNTNVSADKTAALREVVAGMGTETLRKELLTILENDKDLCVGFMLRYNKSDDSMREYFNNKRKNADMILRQCTDHHGFVDWRNASSFASRLIGEVIFDLRDFISDDDEAKEAFDVSLYVFCLFADTDIDDSGGETQYITDECIELWENIIEN
ncbi:MAG: SWIM zinc finger family protein, partial [Clostridiales bacterium]|nr:SWIM zinc finger family protein [Clostridiales bacterium]